MKTIKIFLIIVGFALTGLCFGQLLSENNGDVLYYTAYYKASSNSLEHHVTSSPEKTKPGNYFDALLYSRTYFAPLEYDIPVEDWMTRPFESGYYEEDMQIESWMLSPFECNYFEEDLELEIWMTRPFVVSEQTEEEIIEGEIQIESWMNTPWI